MMWGYWGGAWAWLGPLMMIVFWVLVIGGIVLILKAWWQPQARSGQPLDTAMDLLRERYARGELSREQFEEMRRDLGAK
ncbi:MAG: SHOCT domain-containing protein [Thermaerobacter sp.]|nr:SHOCT domain-containing protein [Thermaerobacter sp.]